jgi:hypothetical protein
METSEVRRHVTQLIDRAKRTAADRRARNDEADRTYARFLEHTAIPLFRQVAGALKAASYNFTVFTPGGGVRLMSDKTADDYVELSLDTSGPQPMVVGHTRRARGQRVVESEQPIADKAVADLRDEDVLEFLMSALGPMLGG